MSNERLEAIKEKIGKLLAKAEGTNNPYEAGVFMAKVNELLNQHQIEMWEIRDSGGGDPMGHQLGEFNVYASMTWAKSTIHMVALYYGTSIVWESKVKNHLPYRIFGPESARVTCELMVPYIISQVRQQARAFKLQHPFIHQKVKGNMVRTATTDSIAQRDVGLALASRIGQILAEAERRRGELVKNSLVPFNDLAAYVENFYEGPLKQSGSKKGYRLAAREFADKISLNRQTPAQGAGALQIGRS